MTDYRITRLDADVIELDLLNGVVIRMSLKTAKDLAGFLTAAVLGAPAVSASDATARKWDELDEVGRG